MQVGYVRVSTIDQNLDLQLDTLKKDGCRYWLFLTTTVHLKYLQF